ncbi:hypothetical protein [Amycolatopsis jejuensis]|uniref:hypothetical protein n=1 Tax=Amycolatopsis jejuensis TaxID=330084 RepID=UPI000A546EBA|nr:hypothetical protein [Amycolatopsis jejuensis]
MIDAIGSDVRVSPERRIAAYAALSPLPVTLILYAQRTSGMHSARSDKSGA